MEESDSSTDSSVRRYLFRKTPTLLVGGTKDRRRLMYSRVKSGPEPRALFALGAFSAGTAVMIGGEV
jgi:hypothetical protein